MFWLTTLGLLLLGSAFVVLPMLFHGQIVDSSGSARNDENVTLYRERLAELRNELDAGDLDEVDFKDLVAELQRSLLQDAVSEKRESSVSELGRSLADISREPRYNTAKEKYSSVVSLFVPLSALILIPILAYSLYDKWGYYDDIQLSELFSQAIHPSDDPQEITELISRFKSAVLQYPDNQWAWYFLGRSYSRLGMYNEAKGAYNEAIHHLDSESDRVMAMSQFVLASFLGAERQLTGEAKSMADRVLAVNPNEMTVLRILATEAREREDYGTAIEYWRRMVRANPVSSSARVYRSNIAAAQKLLASDDSTETEKKEVVSSPQIKVQIALAENLNLVPGQRVFIAARNASRQGIPPLAVAQLTVADLPATVILDNSSAVGPFNLSTADTVLVSALVSQQGVANPQPGDYRVVSEPIKRDVDIIEIDLLIAEEIL